MENIPQTNEAYLGATLNNMPYLQAKDEASKKNFFASSNTLNVKQAATAALKDSPAANRVVVAVLKNNEADINRGLRAVNKPTTGDVVQKSVRLYNATKNKRNAVAGAGLAAVLSNPAVITAILTLVGFLISLRGAGSVDNEEVNEQIATQTAYPGTNYLQMAGDFLSGKTYDDIERGVKTFGLIAVGLIGALVLLVVWQSRK
jgi:hypothetical protein